MRRSLRFFSSCSSSSVIVGFPFEQKIFACHTAQNHPFQSVQIVKTIPAGLAHGAQQRFPWILPHQAQQLPQGKRDYLAAPLFQPHDIVGQLGRGRDDGLLFGMRIGPRIALAARAPEIDEHDSLVLGFGDAPVRDQAAGIELNLDLVLGLAHLHAAADPVHRDRIAVAVQRHIPFDIDQTLLQPVDFWNPHRQWLQMQPLDCKLITRNRPDMFLVSRVDFIAPLPREWCDKVNSTYKKHIRAVPRNQFAVERLHLKPLPVWIPEVYRLQQRLVDIEGYVALNSNRYSVPVDWIGRRVEVRETKDKIEIQLDARRLVTHRRIAEAEHQRVMLAEHRPPRGQRDARPDPHPEEKAIVAAAPELADYVAGLKQRSRKVVTLALRQLLRLVREYPREPLLGAVREAGRYGLYDLDRLERMILRRVTREYFLLDGESDDD